MRWWHWLCISLSNIPDHVSDRVIWRICTWQAKADSLGNVAVLKISGVSDVVNVLISAIWGLCDLWNVHTQLREYNVALELNLWTAAHSACGRTFFFSLCGFNPLDFIASHYSYSSNVQEEWNFCHVTVKFPVVWDSFELPVSLHVPVWVSLVCTCECVREWRRQWVTVF